MFLKDVKDIWKVEFKTLYDLNALLPKLKEEGHCEVLGITQYDYINGGTDYFLWLAGIKSEEGV